MPEARLINSHVSVSYYTDYGTVPSSATNYAYILGSALVEAQLPTLISPGMKHLGWYTSPTFEENTKAEIGKSISTAKLYAKWEWLNVLVNGQTLGEIAQEIRRISGNSELMKPNEMADKIEGIQWAKGVKF